MALEAMNLSFRYHPQQPWILKNINLQLNKGERLAVFAPSGYGKSTLALLLSGYLTPSQGQILIDGKPFLKQERYPVQLIYQHPEKAINPRWKLKQVLYESGSFDDQTLTTFGIEKMWLERTPNELSGGELQRFCVARAMLSGAEYLICDEISTMLDGITQAQIWDVIIKESLRRNLGLMIITHNEHLAKRIATRSIDLTQLTL